MPIDFDMFHIFPVKFNFEDAQRFFIFSVRFKLLHRFHRWWLQMSHLFLLLLPLGSSTVFRHLNKTPSKTQWMLLFFSHNFDWSTWLPASSLFCWIWNFSDILKIMLGQIVIYFLLIPILFTHHPWFLNLRLLKMCLRRILFIFLIGYRFHHWVSL